jgi:lipopolysaccharide/colanic/teichoic acid biosynthesis glycosyltransferase
VSTQPTVAGAAVLSRRAQATAALRTPFDVAPRPVSARWQERYAALVRAVDLSSLTACMTVGVLMTRQTGHQVAALATLIVVVCALGLGRAWEPVVLGTGATEYRRLVRAVVGAAIVVAFGGLALQVDDIVRPWVFGVLPAYAVLAVVLRRGLRVWLHRQRRTGRFQLPVLAVGSHDAVSELIARTRRDPSFGWTVTGACTSTGTGRYGGTDIDGVPVVGDLEEVPAAVRRTGYRVVAVAPGPGWGPRRLHELAWQLEGTRTELAVDPGLTEFGGPRLHVTPVDGMPLVTLCKPRLIGGRRLVKDAVDKVGALLVLAALSVPMVLVAAAVRLDGGPALRREPRIGEGGQPYLMTRFRTTRNDHSGRPSAVGRLVQRYSLDELPQLLDVLAGTMSLVGPRPPKPGEMAGTDLAGARRLLVRPGMTGLWQVQPDRDTSGWDEAMRLDLRYLDTWSLTLDATILLRTVRSLFQRARSV